MGDWIASAFECTVLLWPLLAFQTASNPLEPPNRRCEEHHEGLQSSPGLRCPSCEGRHAQRYIACPRRRGEPNGPSALPDQRSITLFKPNTSQASLRTSIRASLGRRCLFGVPQATAYRLTDLPSTLSTVQSSVKMASRPVSRDYTPNVDIGEVDKSIGRGGVRGKDHG